MANPLVTAANALLGEAGVKPKPDNTPAPEAGVVDEMDKMIHSDEMTPVEQELRDYVEAGAENVLLKGGSGVGKTTLLNNIFKDAGMKMAYFNSTTMDQFIHLVGVPEIVSDAAQKKTLEFIRMKHIDDADAIFIDEINRVSGDKINALFELVEGHSINGIPLPQLKFVWLAMNPQVEDESRAVHQLEDAFVGRIWRIVDVPADPRVWHYTRNKRHPVTERVAKAGAIWWHKDLNTEQREVITPRVLHYIMIGIDQNEKLRDKYGDKWTAERDRRAMESLMKHNTLVDRQQSIRIPFDMLIRRLADMPTFKLPELRNDFPQIGKTLAKLKDANAAQMTSTLLADGLKPLNKSITVDNLGEYSRVILALPRESGMKIIGRTEVFTHFWQKAKDNSLKPEEKAIYQHYRAEIDALAEQYYDETAG